MKRGVIGAVSGLVIGIAIGASVIAPRLNGEDVPLLRPAPSLKLGEGIELLAPTTPPVRIERLSKPEPAPPPKREVEAPVPPPAPETVVKTTPPPTVTLNMESAFSPLDKPAHEQAGRIARVLGDIGDGSLAVKTFGPGQIVATADILSAVASGTLDAAFATPSLWAHRIPALTLFGALPFGPQPDVHLAWYFNGGGKAVYDAAYEANGVKGLICGVAPAPSSGWFVEGLNDVDAFNGLRIQAVGPAALVFERLGATTYNLGPAEARQALGDKKLDGAIFSSPSVDLAFGLKDTAPYYYFPGWQQPTRFLDLIINKDRWNTLNQKQRHVLEIACSDNLRHGLATVDEGQFAALMEIAEAGVEVRRWPDPVINAFRKAWAEIRADMAASHTAFREGWTSLNRFREDETIWRELSRP